MNKGDKALWYNKFIMVPKSKMVLSRIVGMAIVFTIFIASHVNAQILDVPSVSTPDEVVEEMLDIANVGQGDYVIDLGSGDGHIVITAAAKGANGHGVDLDSERIREAEEKARKADVSDKVMFLEEDIFKTDFSRANVITMYLLGTVSRELRPHLPDKLDPGTKVFSHAFNMGDWKPGKQVKVDHVDIYYWVVPANVKGTWQWQANGERFTMKIGQDFQEIHPKRKSGDLSFNIKHKILVGKRISFTVFNPDNGDSYIYNGRVNEDIIMGRVQIHGKDHKSIENCSANLNYRITRK